MALAAADALAQGGLLSVDRNIPFSAVAPGAPVPVDAPRRPGSLFDGQGPGGVVAPAREAAVLPVVQPVAPPPEPVQAAAAAEAPAPVLPGAGQLNLEDPAKTDSKPLFASEMEAEKQSAGPGRLEKSPRIDRLRRILGSDLLTLPRPPATGTVFSAKVVERLGVEDAAASAISKSYQLAAAESKQGYASAQASAARGALLPQVKLSMKTGREKTTPGGDTYKYAKNDILAADGITVLYRKGSIVPSSSLFNGGVNATDLTSESFAYDSQTIPRREKTLSITQSIFDYTAWAEVARQGKVAQAAEHAARGARLKSVLDASSSFLKLFQNSLSLRFAEDYEQALLGLFGRMEERAAAGAGSQADLERVRGRRVNAKSTVLDARNALEVELTAFQKLTGFRPTTLALPPDWILPVPPDAEAALKAAADHNPALQADLKQAESILMELRKSRGGFFPQVSLEMNASQQRGTAGSLLPIVTSAGPNYKLDGSGDLDETRTTGEEQHLTKRTQNLMLVMNWSLFNGGQDYYQNKAMAEKYNEAMFRLLDTRRELEEKLRASFESLATTAARTHEIAKEVEANQQVVESFTEQMFAANRSLLDVLDAHQKLYQSRLDYLRLLIAEASLAYDVLYNIGSLGEALRIPASAQSPRGLMGSLVGQDVWTK